MGHTGIPGIFAEEWEYRSPEEVGHEYALGTGKHLVNVGSVGKPRDGDPRASYVILNGNHLTFRRIEYDLERTVRKIEATPDLANELAEELRQGTGRPDDTHLRLSEDPGATDSDFASDSDSAKRKLDELYRRNQVPEKDRDDSDRGNRDTRPIED